MGTPLIYSLFIQSPGISGIWIKQGQSCGTESLTGGIQRYLQVDRVRIELYCGTSSWCLQSWRFGCWCKKKPIQTEWFRVKKQIKGATNGWNPIEVNGIQISAVIPIMPPSPLPSPWGRMGHSLEQWEHDSSFPHSRKGKPACWGKLRMRQSEKYWFLILFRLCNLSL